MLIPIGKAAIMIGVSVSTMRRWEAEGKLHPSHRTIGGYRRYDASYLKQKFYPESTKEKVAVGYARVSSNDQKDDLLRQAGVLSKFFAQGSNTSRSYLIIKDLGSGLKTNKPGIKKLLKLLLRGEVSSLVLTHEDRLLRFGSNLIFEICQYMGTKVIILIKKRANLSNMNYLKMSFPL